MSRINAPLEWISTLARLVLAGVFIVAGAIKVLDPQTSVQAVRAYELLPEGIGTVVGWGLPFLEIALGLLLAAGLFVRTTAVIVAVVLVAFIAAVASAAARGLSIDCGCFGGGGAVAPEDTTYALEIVRDLCFLALAGWLIWRPTSRSSLDRWHQEVLE